MNYFAHSANRGGRWEPLHEHLTRVAERARSSAAAFGAGDQAFLAGLLHDLGKYSERFDKRLHGAPVSLDHWSIGAVACAQFSRLFGMAAGLVVQGHHVGLGSLSGSAKEFAETLEKAIQAEPERHGLSDLGEARRRLEADRLQPQKPTSGLLITAADDLCASEMLDVRMLFSSLVDADFLETEAHFEGDNVPPRRYRPDGPLLDVESAWRALQAKLANARSGTLSAPLRRVREQLLADCIAAGESQSTGSFTLTAPTGAGKTLAMLAFALAHAKRHGLRRIVLAMPFLNIVDQTAKQYDEMFSLQAGFAEHFVLEQHSLVEDFGESTDDAVNAGNRVRRQLAQNWDAPIVLTTTVQLLESLHASRPGRCRKLHRLAKSVILLDEVQTLPPKLAALTLSTLSRLTDPSGPYGSSIVFATATQPAFETLGERVAAYCRTTWAPREIVADPPAMFEIAKRRTRIEWRDERPVALDDLAEELAATPRVLAIVNLKRHANTLADELQKLVPERVLHLSTNMCPAHREATLATIRAQLADPSNPPTRVVATQCVEAGVDLDFRPIDDRPVLYRAMAPLDSIAQAAGRANRNGLSETARVVVFQVDDQGKATYPPGYREGIGATEILLKALRADRQNPDSLDLIHDPRWIRNYYQNLYAGNGRNRGPTRDEQKLHTGVCAGDFGQVADEYKLIDQPAINIVVPYDQIAFKKLRREFAETKDDGPNALRAWQRKARKHAVAIFPPSSNSQLWNWLDPVHLGEEPETPTGQASWFWLLPNAQYDDLVGLKWPDEMGLIC